MRARLSSSKTSGRRFQRSLAKFKMVSTSGGSRRGSRRENSGHKRSFESTKEREREWEKAHKRISLEKIFQSTLPMILLNSMTPTQKKGKLTLKRPG